MFWLLIAWRGRTKINCDGFAFLDLFSISTLDKKWKCNHQIFKNYKTHEYLTSTTSHWKFFKKHACLHFLHMQESSTNKEKSPFDSFLLFLLTAALIDATDSVRFWRKDCKCCAWYCKWEILVTTRPDVYKLLLFCLLCAAIINSLSPFNFGWSLLAQLCFSVIKCKNKLYMTKQNTVKYVLTLQNVYIH